MKGAKRRPEKRGLSPIFCAIFSAKNVVCPLFFLSPIFSIFCGSVAAALGGLDALVFTAGIGEHAAEIRARICRDAAWLGVELDDAANAANGPRISTAASRVCAWLIPTNEDLMIARHTRRLIDAGA
jgi:acetate kinase